jgi:hypothetical protein
MLAMTSWLLTKVVTTKEPFQLTIESRRKSLPLTVSENWLPPAVALEGEKEVTDGTGGQVPQDMAVTASAIASTAKASDLATVAIGFTSELADAERGAGREFERIGGTSEASQFVRQITNIIGLT